MNGEAKKREINTRKRHGFNRRNCVPRRLWQSLRVSRSDKRARDPRAIDARKRRGKCLTRLKNEAKLDAVAGKMCSERERIPERDIKVKKATARRRPLNTNLRAESSAVTRKKK